MPTDIINNNGVIYYKLAPGYEGDITKNCGLVGSEIDGNFYFLRGYDIKSVEYDEQEQKLKLTRLNGDVLLADIDFTDLQFSFNNVTGELVITYPNQEVLTLSGFTTDNNNSRIIISDGTLIGDGTLTNPLAINPIEKTGEYAPANTYLDITEGAELPTEGIGFGYRILTKELETSKFGLLYSIDGLNIINNILSSENSEWRIPSKSDWDELLNALEPEGYKNHATDNIGDFGLVAGQALKSIDFWDENENPEQQSSTQGLDIVGMQIYPAGKDESGDMVAEEFGRTSVMWSTSLISGGAYVKKFFYNMNTVNQSITNGFFSIRLVKEFTSNNYQEVENILGGLYPTVLVRIPESNYYKIWTKINIAPNNDIFPELVENQNYININLDGHENLIENDVAYYINEWTGTFWRKKKIKEGESIVILDKDGIKYKEWLLKNGELYDFQSFIENTLELIQEQLNNMASFVKNTVKDYLIGTNNEISISEDENQDKLKISFSDDAIFG